MVEVVVHVNQQLFYQHRQLLQTILDTWDGRYIRGRVRWVEPLWCWRAQSCSSRSWHWGCRSINRSCSSRESLIRWREKQRILHALLPRIQLKIMPFTCTLWHVIIWFTNNLAETTISIKDDDHVNFTLYYTFIRLLLESWRWITAYHNYLFKTYS